MQEEQQRKKRAYKLSNPRQRWSHEEHQQFLEALKVHGRQWKKIEGIIQTKSAIQIRSHAQKYFNKLEREQYDDKSQDYAGGESLGDFLDPYKPCMGLLGDSGTTVGSTAQSALLTCAASVATAAAVVAALSVLRAADADIRRKLQQKVQEGSLEFLRLPLHLMELMDDLQGQGPAPVQLESSPMEDDEVPPGCPSEAATKRSPQEQWRLLSERLAKVAGSDPVALELGASQGARQSGPQPVESQPQGQTVADGSNEGGSNEGGSNGQGSYTRAGTTVQVAGTEEQGSHGNGSNAYCSKTHGSNRHSCQGQGSHMNGSNGYGSNGGHGSNMNVSNGYGSNGHGSNGYQSNGDNCTSKGKSSGEQRAAGSSALPIDAATNTKTCTGTGITNGTNFSSVASNMGQEASGAVQGSAAGGSVAPRAPPAPPVPQRSLPAVDPLHLPASHVPFQNPFNWGAASNSAPAACYAPSSLLPPALPFAGDQPSSQHGYAGQPLPTPADVSKPPGKSRQESPPVELPLRPRAVTMPGPSVQPAVASASLGPPVTGASTSGTFINPNLGFGLPSNATPPSFTPYQSIPASTHPGGAAPQRTMAFPPFFGRAPPPGPPPDPALAWCGTMGHLPGLFPPLPVSTPAALFGNAGHPPPGHVPQNYVMTWLQAGPPPSLVLPTTRGPSFLTPPAAPQTPAAATIVAPAAAPIGASSGQAGAAPPQPTPVTSHVQGGEPFRGMDAGARGAAVPRHAKQPQPQQQQQQAMEVDGAAMQEKRSISFNRDNAPTSPSHERRHRRKRARLTGPHSIIRSAESGASSSGVQEDRGVRSSGEEAQQQPSFTFSKGHDAQQEHRGRPQSPRLQTDVAQPFADVMQMAEEARIAGAAMQSPGSAVEAAGMTQEPSAQDLLRRAQSCESISYDDANNDFSDEGSNEPREAGKSEAQPGDHGNCIGRKE